MRKSNREGESEGGGRCPLSSHLPYPPHASPYFSLLMAANIANVTWISENRQPHCHQQQSKEAVLYTYAAVNLPAGELSEYLGKVTLNKIRMYGKCDKIGTKEKSIPTDYDRN